MKNLIQFLLFLLFYCLYASELSAQGYLPRNADTVRPNLFLIEKTFLAENARLAVTDSLMAAKQRKHFNRWAFDWRNRVTSTGDFPDLQQVTQDRERFLDNQRTKSQNRGAQWRLAIPKNVKCVGRVNCMAMHPSQPNVIWAASANGGLWRTNVSGDTWSLMTQGLSNVLQMGQVVIAPSAPNTVYATTKDHGSNELFTTRLIKTNDGGATWQTINLETFGISGYTSRLLVHPTQPNRLLLACYGRGIFQSFDGGLSWQKTLNGYAYDMCYNPLNPETIYAVMNSGQVWVSYDSGQHFILRGTNSFSDGCRMTMTAADTNRLYFSNNKLVVSYDAGLTFKTIQGNTSMGSYTVFYANCIAVSPKNAADVFLGGIYMNRFVLAGEKATVNVNRANVNIHPDHQFMQFVTDSIVLLANDGGAWVSYDAGYSFADITNNMSIMQYVRLGLSPFDADEWLAGAQDNGTHLYTKSNYTQILGGDGMDCFYDSENPKIVYYSFQNGGLFKKTLDKPKPMIDYVDISRQLTGTGGFITPFLLHPTNPKILYAGYNKLYRSMDAGETPLEAVTPGFKSLILNIRTTLQAPDAVYFTVNQQLFKFNNKTLQLNKLTIPNDTVLLGGGNINYYGASNFTVSALDSNTLWATYGGYLEGRKVFKSINGGSSWTNISEGLPNIAIYCIVEQPNANGTLYLGTELGVFRRDNSKTQWEYWSNGLPAASVIDLKIQYTAQVIRVATYARAIWEAPLEQASTPLTDFVKLTGETENDLNHLHWTTLSESGNDAFTLERSSDNVKFSPIKTVAAIGFSTKPTLYNSVDILPNKGDNYYRIRYRIGFNNEKTISNTIKLSNTTERNLYVFPNPTDGRLTVGFRVKQYPYVCQLDIFAANGQHVHSDKALFSERFSEQTLNISNLASGSYILRVTNSRDEVIEQCNFIKN
jgi:photosystem II stability/assembly factor-like uncharacterized protein